MKRNDSYLKILHAQLRDFASERDRDRLRELADALRTGIRHPLEVADSGLFTDAHPVRLEALAVFDAFEAVTNGMENPEAMERVAALPGHSIFSPWKPLILAISAFYRGDPAALGEQLARISPDSIPGLLVPFLETLPDAGPGSGRGEAARELASAVIDDDPLLRSGLSQLEDALEEGIEELFVETAVLLFRDLAARQPTTAERLLLWCFRALREAGLSVEALSLRIRSSLPACRLHRLEALAAMDGDPAAALLAWGRSLLAGLREEALNLTEVRQYVRILQELLDAAEKRGSLPEAVETDGPAGSGLRRLAEELAGELSFRFAIASTELPPANRPRALLRAVAAAVAAEDPQPQEPQEPQEPQPQIPEETEGTGVPAHAAAGGRNGSGNGSGNGHSAAGGRRGRAGRAPEADHRAGEAMPPKQLELFSFADAPG